MTGHQIQGWEFVYDSWFARVYDANFDKAIDLQMKDDRVFVQAEGRIELDLPHIERLRKLLQMAERKIKKEYPTQ